MVNARHKEVLKGLTSKEVGPSASDADHGGSDNGSSSSFEDLNFRRFTDKETKDLSSMISRQVGKAIKNAMPYYISQTIDNLKEVVQKELKEFKKGGIMNNFRNEMATYRDFTACDVLKFDGTLDPIASTRWLFAIEGSGYHQKDRKPSQNDKTEHGMEKTVQNQGQSPKMPKSESIQKNQQSNRSRN
ncbi:hypothetical protein Tco_1548874 [Tanacetum coccineum]